MDKNDNLTFYEDFLKNKRGWISQWPQKVVFIYSGGMDSTITIAKLLTERKIEIFPLFINRGQTNLVHERKSVQFFNKFFKEKYDGFYHDYFEINVNIPPVEIKEKLKPYTEKHGHPLRNTILQMVGVQYAISLLSSGHEIKSVFCAQVPDDPFPHSTLTSLRVNTINICNGLDEWDWQITSPNIDPILSKEQLFKIDMVKWADNNGIPLERTRSCYTPDPKPCGVCLTCRRRREAFKLAGVTDRTVYK